MASRVKLWKRFVIWSHIGVTGPAVDSIETRIRKEWSKFIVLVPLFASTVLLSGAKGRFFCACAGSIMLHGSETWPVKKEDVIGPERNSTRMVRWRCNFRPDRISADEPRTRLKLKSTRESFQDTRFLPINLSLTHFRPMSHLCKNQIVGFY